MASPSLVISQNIWTQSCAMCSGMALLELGPDDHCGPFQPDPFCDSMKQGWKKVNSTHKFIVSRVRAFWSCSCFPSTDLVTVWQKIKFSLCTWGRAIWEVLENKKVINMNVHALAKKTNKKYQMKSGLLADTETCYILSIL